MVILWEGYCVSEVCFRPPSDILGNGLDQESGRHPEVALWISGQPTAQEAHSPSIRPSLTFHLRFMPTTNSSHRRC